MRNPSYSISKLLPLVLICSSVSVVVVYFFRFISLNPFYPQVAEKSNNFVPALLAIPLFIGLFYLFAKHLNSGLPHIVLEFHIGSGKLPILNFIFQFLGASVALLFGFAVGAIGPAIHIGAGASNLTAQLFKVPPCSLRVLTACGAAAAITIMLDTPLMAILFTYETIIRQFRGRTLVLVTASALFAQWLGHQYIGSTSFQINLEQFELSMALLGFLLLFGLICGLLSASFLNCIDFLTRKIRLNYWKKITLAALFTALLSWLSPESIGLGYQLLDRLLYDQQLPSLLMLWFLIRFIGSIAVISLAIPGGALGPSLILGALTGAIFSQLLSIEAGQLFVVVGMGAFLGAVLRVPLAGMLFVLEATNEITLIIPCIIASYAAFYLHKRLSTYNNLIELLLVRQKIILRDSPSLKKKRLTSPL